MIAILVVALAVALPLDCADPVKARQQIGRAQTSEIEQIEDAHWGVLREGLTRCRAASDRLGCESARRAEFQTGFARSRAAIQEKYRRTLDEWEARCRAPLAAAGVRRG